MGGRITGRGTRLTAKQEQFVRLVVEEGHTFVSAYKATYPPRQATRSAEAERVAAKRVAHHPLVQARIEQPREELLASDPVEMRRLALATLADIMAKRLDPRYRRTALDVLHYLDEQERAAAAAEWRQYQAFTDRLTALDAAELALERCAATSSPRRRPKAAPLEPASQAGVDGRQGEQQRPLHPEDAQVAERRRAELEQLVAERQRVSQSEDRGHLVPPVKDAQRDDPPQATEEGTEVNRGSLRVRVPGHFGKAAWKRVPAAR